MRAAPIQRKISNHMAFEPGNSWAFKPGQTGNPLGRKPGGIKDLETMAKKLCPEAIEIAAKIMRNAKAKGADRLRAVEIILNRGMGAPKQHLEVLHDTGKLSDDELSQRIVARINEVVAGILAAGSGVDGASAGGAETLN